MPDHPIPAPVEARHLWRAQREAMESAPYRTAFRGDMRRHLHRGAAAAKRLFDSNDKVSRRIAERVIAPQLTALHLSFPDLPEEFDGYRILHLTDLHLDNIEATASLTAARMTGIVADLCVITGDVRDNMLTPLPALMERLGAVIGGLEPADGIMGILGNHDSAAMVEPMERLGIRMLINETAPISRGDARIHLTGLDDVHLFRTDAALEALRNTPEGFGIALVHSPEIACQAAARHSLYLCGHTHGGALSLPGRGPIITRLKKHRRYARGLWMHDGMIGYTSSGIGASLVPSRFGRAGEIALITLTRGPLGAVIEGR
ncbi:MAG: hypothetical protein OQJ76_04230 [Rhodospirillales bacterium]|nr:hypothetical protein [Rhodospirillales bacterium]